jgi:predicted PurR-regulated permease PerM
LVSRLTGALSSVAAVAGGAFIILFVGCYVAADPHLYVDGVVRLVPRAYRTRARALIQAVVRTLRWWLLAKVIEMVVVGGLVTAGLLILGIPLAGTLGGLAGVLTFIPNIGPIVSTVPPLLLALAISPERALAVALLVWGVHGIEGFFVTPIVEQRTVKLPPAVTIGVQLLLGAVSGGIGVALAAPLAAAGLVLVRGIYVEDVLGDLPGNRPVGPEAGAFQHVASAGAQS